MIYNFDFSVTLLKSHTHMSKILHYLMAGTFLLAVLPAFSITDTTQLDFMETFDSGSFATNNWTMDSGNWGIFQQGAPSPSAAFNGAPTVQNYNSSLTSCFIEASGLIDGRIYLNFDISRLFVNKTSTEFLSVEVFNGTEWIEKVRYTNASDKTWTNKTIDITNEAMGVAFRIRFRASGANSLNVNRWLIDNIFVYRKCNAPKDLTATMPDPENEPCSMMLEWTEPDLISDINTWLHWDDGLNYETVGLMGGGTFYGAARFAPYDLALYDGLYLTKIRIYPVNNGGSYTLMVWTGPNASQLVTSQPVTSYVHDRWNEYTLNTPVQIDADEELWIGFMLVQGTTLVAGIDVGPSNINGGDMISNDGTTWYSLAVEYSIDGNWNLGGYLSENPAEPAVKNSDSFTEYQIFRNNELIATTTDTSYLDDFSGVDWPCYLVKAKYTDCESIYSNMACLQGAVNPCTVDVDDVLLNSFRLYPNPSSSRITVEAKAEAREITIYDITGRSIIRQSADPSGKTSIDIGKLNEGIYLIQITGMSTNISAGKLMIRR